MLECRHCSQRFQDNSALEEHALAMHQLELGLQQLPDSRHKIRPQWQAQAAQDSSQLAQVLRGVPSRGGGIVFPSERSQYSVYRCINCDAKFVRPLTSVLASAWPHLATSFCGLNCMWSSHFRHVDAYAEKVAWIQAYTGRCPGL